jgi:hypothetical protein
MRVGCRDHRCYPGSDVHPAASSIGSDGLAIKDGGSIVVEPGGNITLENGSFNAGTVSAATTVTAGTDVDAGGNVNASGNVNGANGVFPTGVSSVGAFNLDVSTLPGTRHTSWIHSSGAMGFAPSTREKKTNIRPYDKPASAFLACQPQMFEYIAQVDIRDNPANPYYDPTYVVPTDTGALAEDLCDNDLGEFVFYEEDGTTLAGIDYVGFCAVGMLVIGRDHETRLQALEAKF